MPLTISVIGTGYLGVVHAACMADLGHIVIAIDTDAAKVESLSRGVPPIYEPGLEELLASVLPTGRLRFTTDYAEAAGADVHFIWVGTPQRKREHAADTSYVFAAGESLAPYLRAEALVVGKSTVPVGTVARLLDRLHASSLTRSAMTTASAASSSNAGVGIGGGCPPKDIRAFMARADELGADQALTSLREVDEINLRQRSRMVDLAREHCGGTLIGKRVAVLGAACKRDSDDIRDSPALDVAEAAPTARAVVTVHDPEAMEASRQVLPDLLYADNLDEACKDADVVLHLTEWKQFGEIDPAKVAVVVANPAIDGRNALDPTLRSKAGWTYRALGSPESRV